MAGSTGAEWPVMSIAETRKVLTAPGMPFEMETLTIRGIPTRVYKNAPPHLRAVLDQSRQWEDREILVYEGERLTYGDHYRAVSALSRVLTERYGLKKGDRAAIAMRNFPEWSIAFWAAIAIGAVVTPLNAWGTGDDLSYGISDSEAKVAVVDAERLERLRPYLSHLALAGLVAVRTPADQLGSAEALEALIGPPSQYKSLPDTPPPDNGIQPEDDATIFYTSGTTGRPKGALGTHRNIMTNLINVGYGTYRAMLRRGEAIPEPDPNAPQRTMLLPVPFFHVTGCHSVLVPTMAAGGRLILIEGYRDGFDTLSAARQAVGMPALTPAKINFYSYLRDLMPAILEHFTIEQTWHSGMFDFLTRLVYPQLAGAENTHEPGSFHEKIEPLVRANALPDLSVYARLHGFCLVRKP